MRPAQLAVLSVLIGLAPSAASQTNLQQARNILERLAAGQFEAARQDFDATLQAALPVERLAQVWQSLTTAYGSLQGIGEPPGSAAATDASQVILTCRFERATLEAIFQFRNGKIAGLLFRPAAESSPWRAPSYADPGRFQETPVQITTGRWQLPGTLTLPRGQGPFAAVVLVHGSGPQDADETIEAVKPFRDLAWGLASRGIAVLRYVKRTRQYGAASSDDFTHFTVVDETVADAHSALALLAGRAEIDPRRIFLLGHSLGATLAPRIAASAPHRPAGLILLAGAVTPVEQLALAQVQHLAQTGKIPPEAAARQLEALRKAVALIESPQLEPGMVVNFLGAPTPASYWLDLRSYHPAEVLAQLRVPTLILQAGADEQVPMHELELWRQALAGRPQVRFQVFPGLNHLFVPVDPSPAAEAGHVARAVIETIAQWIAHPVGEGQP